MARSYGTVVSDCLIQAGSIDSADALSSFTLAQKQIDIDVMKSIVREVVRELVGAEAFPTVIAEDTITLVTSTREYSVASDFVSIADYTILGRNWGQVFINATDERLVFPYPGGYAQMRFDQPDPSNFTGSPEWWVIEPINGKIRFDKDATASENGDQYKYQYNKELIPSAFADTFPIKDQVLDDLYEAIIQRWKLRRRGPKAFVKSEFVDSMARAARHVSQVPKRSTYGNTRGA